MLTPSLTFDRGRQLKLYVWVVACGLLAAATAQAQAPVAIAVHGGAGTIREADLTPEQADQYRSKLAEALGAGHRLLVQGGTSLDAVTAAIEVLEASPYLKREDILEAISYAAWRAEEIEVPLAS